MQVMLSVAPSDQSGKCSADVLQYNHMICCEKLGFVNYHLDASLVSYKLVVLCHSAGQLAVTFDSMMGV